MLKNFRKIAVAHGDGIGPEIMNAVLAIFKASKVPLNFQPVDMGKTIYLSGFSNGMTPDAKKTVEETGILFKGPMETPKGSGVKSINVTARKVWSTFANKRVFKTYPGVDTIFSRAGIPIDLTLVRENIEDTYGGIEHFQTNDVAQCRRLITRGGSAQVHKYTFELAKAKKARRVTCGHKANIMKLTDGLFLEEFYKIAKEYPEIKSDDVIVDDLAMKLVTNPTLFDVVVLPNLQGDIISDLCAGLVGGLGMAPSANIGENVSIFEAVHGTAPDIAGQGLANPTALLLSGIMMLRHLGFEDHANGVAFALEEALKNGERTKDLAPPKAKGLSTSEFAEAVIRRFPANIKDAKIEVKLPEGVEKKIGSEPAQNPMKENVMHKSENRDRTKEKNVGVDVFVDTELGPKALAWEIMNGLPSGYTLQMLSNRGTQVWPTGSNLTEVVNHYRARVIRTDQASLPVNDLLSVVAELSKKIRVCSLEILMQIDGKDLFTKAQGQ